MNPRVRAQLQRARRFLEAATEDPPCSLQEQYPQHEIGRHTYGDLEVRDDHDGGSLRIGPFCSIGPGVQVFLGGEHRTDWVSTFPFTARWRPPFEVAGHPRSRGPVVIGADVWLGAESLVLSGVTIGPGAVVGARSVVTRDVEPYSVVTGAPARHVRHRFDAETRERLLHLAWWDWPDVQVERALPWLCQPDVSAFLTMAEDGRFEDPQP